jgi:muconate cycloisomerase
MLQLRTRLSALSIPLTMSFAHAAASRAVCDSLILELSDGENTGYGETVLREYVNSPGGFPPLTGLHERTVMILQSLLSGGKPRIEELRTAVLDDRWPRQELPLLAAAEGAVLDLLCRREGKDIYALLGREPLREEITYGGILPVLPEETAERFLYRYRKMGIPNLRVKLTADFAANERVLQTARRVLGDRFDIRADVNGAWDLTNAPEHLELCADYGVLLIEEPLGPDRSAMRALAERTRDLPVSFTADESAVTAEDVEAVLADRTFGMLNLRLAKNGGLLRTLSLAERAGEEGLGYQLGCHVGETGLLSAEGRIAAGLMEEPRYVDGSFDEFLLTENLTAESFTFGPGGKAPVIRGPGMGREVEPGQLEKHAAEQSGWAAVELPSSASLP